jgi:hypothetical protein
MAKWKVESRFPKNNWGKKISHANLNLSLGKAAISVLCTHMVKFDEICSILINVSATTTKQNLDPRCTYIPTRVKTKKCSHRDDAEMILLIFADFAECNEKNPATSLLLVKHRIS